MELSVGYDHCDEIADATGQLADADEDRKIGDGETGPALPRDIASRKDPNDTRTRRRLLGMDGKHSGPRMLGEHDRSVNHPRHPHVVDVRPLAQYLFDAADSRMRFADAVALRRCELKLGIAVKTELLAEE
jgi:hypothetical protein